MLTVDFERLQLRAGLTLLDMGCGGGRHAFAALRLGADVLAFDADGGELKEVRATIGAMAEAGELTDARTNGGCGGGQVQGDALELPFPDDSLDRIVCSEVLEHVWDDDRAISELVRVLKPGGRMAVTVPTRFPERVNWALDWHYNDTPGGHIRIYRQRDLEAKLARAGLWLRGSHHAHALHSPYWWIRCAGGVDEPDRYLARKYHDLLVWQLTENPKWLARLDRALNPLIGKSLVIYTQKTFDPRKVQG